MSELHKLLQDCADAMRVRQGRAAEFEVINTEEETPVPVQSVGAGSDFAHEGTTNA